MRAHDYAGLLPADFHSFSEGRPQSFLFQQFSLDSLPSRDRYAFFGSEVLSGVTLARPQAGQERDFGAELVSMSSAGCAMHAARTGDFECRRGLCEIREDGGEGYSLVHVRSGRVHVHIAGDGARVHGAGDFVLLPGACPVRMRFSDAEFVQMDLTGLLPCPGPSRPPSLCAMADALNRSPLRRLLQAQLDLFPSATLDMGEAERVVQLATTEQLALGVLQSLVGDISQERAGHRAEQALFHAACRYIEQHLHHSTLDPQQVATALQCSRATLYRAFAARGKQVAAVIRTLRLQRVRELLGRYPETPIGTIAARCGFYDLRSFNRAFRACFGCTPGRAREELRGLAASHRQSAMDAERIAASRR